MGAGRLLASKCFPLVTTQARFGDPGQGGAVSVGPIWHACIAIHPAKHQIGLRRGGVRAAAGTKISYRIFLEKDLRGFLLLNFSKYCDWYKTSVKVPSGYLN